MKFVNHTDVLRPASIVYDRVTAFDSLEARARAANIEVERLKGDGAPVVGAEWLVKGQIAGTQRETNVRLVKVVEPSTLEFKNTSPGYEIDFAVQVMPLAPNRTRLRTIVDIKARSLAARVMLQSARLVRPRIVKRIDTALKRVATRIEAET